MKKSKIIKSILAVTMAVGFTVLGAACGGGGNSGGATEDKTKTQLTVKFYGAGYGTEWISDYAKKFEEKYKDYKNGDKVGVQVITDGTMTKYSTVQELESNAYDVYFLEGVDFASFAKAGAFEDISNIVTVQNSDNKTIESKLDETQKDYFKVNGSYYGLPHYTGAYGIVYNVDLFEENNLYIKDGYTVKDFLISDKSDKKSKGPDGKTGVIDGIDYSADDGLPATYDEFFKLCDEMKNLGITPIGFTGQYRWDYTAKFMDNLVANYNGAKEQRLNYTFDGGEATKLVKVTSDGKIDLSNGAIQLEKANITSQNGYELARQAGVYYAANFLERMVEGGTRNPKYVSYDSLGDSFTHKQAQKAFLNNETAMIIDGDWWLNEASASITDANKKSRKFGWMPLPHATEEQIGERQVYTDNMAACVAVKSGLNDVTKELAMNFVKDFYTDDNLVAFTKKTNTFIGVDYKAALAAAENDLTPYALSLNKYIQNADIMYQISNVDFFNLNYTTLQSVQYYKVGSSNTQPLQYIIENGKTGAEYFEAFYAGMKGKKIWK